jgi:hypothetical protein
MPTCKEELDMEDMNFYNKHYITVDEQNRIVDGFSDAFRQPSETDILLTDKGGYQFRLHYLVYDPTYELTWHHRVSEENPALYDWNGMIPLYKYEGGYVKRRTEEEIEADRAALPKPETPTTEPSVWDELDAAYMEGVNHAYE